MTENLKAFLESISGDDAFIEKLNKAKSMEEVIALAAEKDFALTAEDLKNPAAPTSKELSDDELDAVAGGECCACTGAGLGRASEVQYGTEGDCYCVIGGGGELYWDWAPTNVRCLCIMGGAGYDNKVIF